MSNEEEQKAEEKKEPVVHDAFGWTGRHADPDWSKTFASIFHGVVNAFNAAHEELPSVTPDERHKVIVTKVEGAKSIVVENLTLVRPDTENPTMAGSPKLIENMNVEIKPGMRVAIMGKNGSGKTSFLRSLIGQHPYGEGRIFMPKDYLALPQNPYISDRPFREAVTYPASDANFTDEQIADALRAVDHAEMIPLLSKSENRLISGFLVPYAAQLQAGYSYLTDRLPDDKMELFAGQLLDNMNEGMGRLLATWEIQHLHKLFMEHVEEGRKTFAANPDTYTTHFSKMNVKTLAKGIGSYWKEQVEFPKEQHWIFKLPRALKNLFNHLTGQPLKSEAEMAAHNREVDRLNAIVEYQENKRIGLSTSGSKLQMEKSGGQKQRLRVATILLLKPKILLGDEITSALDEEAAHEMMQKINDALPQDAITMLVIHDRGLMKYFNTIAEVKDGKLELRPYDAAKDEKPVNVPAGPGLAP